MLLKIPPLYVIEAHYPKSVEGSFTLIDSTMVIWGQWNELHLSPDRLLEISDTPNSNGDYIQIKDIKGGARLILKDFYEFCVSQNSISRTIKNLGKPSIYVKPF